MSYNRPTLEEIQARVKADIESYVTDGVPLAWVKLLGILGHAFSGASHLQHGFLSQIKKEIFITTASEWGLTQHGNRYGLPRKAANHSSGYIRPTGTGTPTVPDETLWVNSEGYEYQQQGAFTVGTDSEVELVAVEAGADSNTTDETLTLSSGIVDVDSDAYILDVLSDDTVPPQFDNGTNLEGIEAWRLRLLQRCQNPPSSGNKGDYVRWALEIAGVGRAWCMPSEIWGLGSCGVFVASYDEENLTIGVVSDSILSAVETYIDSVRPIPANVEYRHITPKNAAYTMAITPNTEEQRDAIEQNLKQLHILEAEPGGTMLVSHIRHAIKTAGVNDYYLNSISVEDYGVTSPGDDFSTDYPDIPVYYGTLFNDL